MAVEVSPAFEAVIDNLRHAILGEVSQQLASHSQAVAQRERELDEREQAVRLELQRLGEAIDAREEAVGERERAVHVGLASASPALVPAKSPAASAGGGSLFSVQEVSKEGRRAEAEERARKQSLLDEKKRSLFGDTGGGAALFSNDQGVGDLFGGPSDDFVVTPSGVLSAAEPRSVFGGSSGAPPAAMLPKSVERTPSGVTDPLSMLKRNSEAEARRPSAGGTAAASTSASPLSEVAGSAPSEVLKRSDPVPSSVSYTRRGDSAVGSSVVSNSSRGSVGRATGKKSRMGPGGKKLDSDEDSDDLPYRLR